jgi:hypothetical protein
MDKQNMSQEAHLIHGLTACGFDQEQSKIIIKFLNQKKFQKQVLNSCSAAQLMQSHSWSAPYYHLCV